MKKHNLIYKTFYICYNLMRCQIAHFVRCSWTCKARSEWGRVYMFTANFLGVRFCQKLAKVPEIWQIYYKNEKGDVFLRCSVSGIWWMACWFGVQVKLAYQESELASQLKKLPLGSAELSLIRDRAEKLRDGRSKPGEMHCCLSFLPVLSLTHSVPAKVCGKSHFQFQF